MKVGEYEFKKLGGGGLLGFYYSVSKNGVLIDADTFLTSNTKEAAQKWIDNKFQWDKALTQVERNARYLETNKKARITLVVDASTQELKEKHGFTHPEIYEAGLKYLIEQKEKLQQSDNSA